MDLDEQGDAIDDWEVFEPWIEDEEERVYLQRTGPEPKPFNPEMEYVSKTYTDPSAAHEFALRLQRRGKKGIKISQDGRTVSWYEGAKLNPSGEIQDLASRMPTKYLRDFFAEKDIPEVTWTIAAPDGTEHTISNVVVVEHIATVGKDEAKKIADVLRRIDFANADVNHFLRHLATALVNQYPNPNPCCSSCAQHKPCESSCSGGAPVRAVNPVTPNMRRLAQRLARGE